MSFSCFSACLSVLLSWTSFVVSSTFMIFFAAVVTLFSGVLLRAVMNLWWKWTVSEMQMFLVSFIKILKQWQCSVDVLM